MIRNVNISNAKAITDIYNYYIQNTIITFEKDLIDEDEIKNVSTLLPVKGFHTLFMKKTKI